MVLGLSGVSNEIKIKLGTEKDCVQSVSVEMPATKVREKIEAAYLDVQARVKLPGFRPGKAPLEMIRESHREAAYEHAQDLLLREGVAEAIKVKKIPAIHTPVVQSVQFDPAKSFQFDFNVEISPVFKPSGYKGLKLARKPLAVIEDDVQKSVQQVAEMNSRLVESKAESLTASHFAVITYEGFTDGKPIPGAKSENFLMDLSAPQAIAGLADGLVGAKVGDERDVSVHFPEDSPAKELAGKPAVFKVKVIAIKEKSIPALDDDFAKDLGFESLAELKVKVRENLESERKQSSQADLERQVVEKLLEGNTFAVPPSQIDRQTEHLFQKQKERLTRQGMSEADVAKLLEPTAPEARKQAEKDVRLAYVLNAIADAERIAATDDEITSKINEILERSQPTEREAMGKTLNANYRDRLRSEVRESKLFVWLIQNAKIKE